MMEKMAVLVMGYNRYRPLANLLEALKQLHCNEETPLIISIDGGGTKEINDMVNQYVWPYGEKEVVIHPSRLGLRNHFLWAGDQTQKYENILFLEDDLLPSPYALEAAKQLVSKYKDTPKVVAGALYSPLLCEFNGSKFYKVQDGNDVFFFAHPYWGTIWMKKAWSEFRTWFETYEYKAEYLPRAVQEWKNQSSFKKVFIQYLSETGKTCVYPRQSFVTNMGFAGENAPLSTDSYQSQLQICPPNFRMPEYEQSKSRYDVFFEIDSEIIKEAYPALQNYDFEVDLKQTRTVFTKPYVLTTRAVRNPIMTFSSRMKPLENVFFFDIKGTGISLAKKEDVIMSKRYWEYAANDIKANYPLEPRVVLKVTELGAKKYFARKWKTIKKKIRNRK